MCACICSGSEAAAAAAQPAGGESGVTMAEPEPVPHVPELEALALIPDPLPQSLPPRQATSAEIRVASTLSRTDSATWSTTTEEASWKKILLLLVFITAGILCLVLLPVKEWMVTIFSLIEELEWKGVALVVVLYIPVALLNLPSGLMGLGCGAVYGRWVGLAVALLGYHTGALAGLFAGRYLVKCCVEGYIQKSTQLRLILKLIQARPLTFVAICRVSPFLPYTPTNYIFGFGSDVSPLKFTASTFCKS